MKQIFLKAFYGTRKSSCMNARGIPTAAYQVLHMLLYPGMGVPTLAGLGVVPTLDEEYLRWPRGVPTLAGGYLPW